MHIGIALGTERRGGPSGIVGPALYFSATGSDASNGLTPATAKQTIAHLNTLTVASGTTVAFKGGDTFAGQVEVQNGVNYTSYGTGKAIISVPDVSFGSAFHGYGKGTSNNTFSYLKISGPGYANLNQTAGFDFGEDTTVRTQTDITVSNCEITGVNTAIGFGNDIASNWNRLTFQNNYIHDCRGGGIGNYSFNSASLGLIWAQFLNVVIRNNVVTNCGADGIVWAGCTGALIENNVVSNCGAITAGKVGIWLYDAYQSTIQYCESYNNTSGGADGGGFDLDQNTQQCTIQYCYSHGNKGPGYMIYAQVGKGADTCGNNTVRFCISENDASNSTGYGSLFVASNGTSMLQNYIYGNTIYQSQAGCHAVQIDTNAKGIFANNIFMTNNATANLYKSGATRNASAVFKGNDWYGAAGTNFIYNATNYGSLALLQAADTTFEKPSGTNIGLTVDPLLTTPGSGGTLCSSGTSIPPVITNANLTAYKLQAGSTLRGAGRDIASENSISQGSLDYFGNTLALPNSVGAHDF